MAKINVKGMKIEDILKMPYEEWNALSTSDLKALTQRLNSAANKRIKRLSAGGMGKYSPALQGRRVGHKKTGEIKKFTTKLPKGTKKDVASGKVKSMFAEVKGFLNAKTSTDKGAKEFKKGVLGRFPQLVNKNGKVSEYKLKRLWKAYHAVKDNLGIAGSLGQVLDSKEFQNAIASAIQTGAHKKAGLSLPDFMSRVFDEKARNQNVPYEEIFKKVQRGEAIDEDYGDEEGFEMGGDELF